MKTRRFVAAATAAAIAASTAALSVPTPAGAQEGPGTALLSGNFVGDARDEIFEYTAGPATDYLVSLTNNGNSGGEITSTELTNHQVNGTYSPFVGNFDGDAFDEILWYAPGTTADFVWNFPAWTSHTSKPYTVNGYYEPVVGDYTGDHVDDILWYKAGTGADSLWEYNANGAYTAIPRTVNGSYTPISGSFGKDNTDDIFWYKEGTGPDSLWDYKVNTFNYTSIATPVNGFYEPLKVDIFNDGWRGEDIYWFSPSGPDSIFDYILGTKFNAAFGNIDGAQTAVAGDFLGDGHSDVFWFGEAGLTIWDYAPDFAAGQIDLWEYLPVAPEAAGRSAAGPDTAVDGIGSAAQVGTMAIHN